MGKKEDRPYHKVKRLEELVVLSLDSSCYGNNNGEISEETVLWLAAALEKNQGLPLFLMTHHHFLDGHREYSGSGLSGKTEGTDPGQ